jgi:hypothetical protein
MGRTPVTLAVKSMVLLVISLLVIKESDSRPEAEVWTTPAELKAVIAGAWVTVRLAMVVVAKVDVPVAVKTVSVVEPVTFRVPEKEGELDTAREIVPADDVAMVMFDPADNEPTCQEEPLAINNWPLTAGAVLMPVPPEEIPKALAKVKVVAEAVPATSNLYSGFVVPIPTLPVEFWT